MFQRTCISVTKNKLTKKIVCWAPGVEILVVPKTSLLGVELNCIYLGKNYPSCNILFYIHNKLPNLYLKLVHLKLDGSPC